MSAGSIVVDLLLRTGSFSTDTKRAEKDLKQLEKSVEAAAQKMALGFTVASGAVVAMVYKTTQAAEEVKRFSALAGASATEFQIMAAGAQTVGISQEKLADQFKDFREKFGEYLDTGGGGMKDFFENIAPKIGVTADQFRKLSGPQALQLYVSSLEKANLSQEQMSFYLESMASDTTALIPLLRDNGKAMGELGERARETGQIMSDELIENSVQFRREMDQLQGALQGATNTLVQDLMPALLDLTTKANSSETGMTALEVAFAGIKVVFQTIAVLGSDVAFVFKGIGLEIGGAIDQAKALATLDFTNFAQIAHNVRKQSEEARKELDAFQRRVMGTEEPIDMRRGRGYNSNRAGATGKATPSEPIVVGETAEERKAREEAEKKAKDAAKKSEQDHAAWLQTFLDGEEQYRNALHAKRLDEGEQREKDYQEMLIEFEQASSDRRQEIHTQRLEEQEEAEKGYWDRWLQGAQEAMTSFNELASSVINNFTTGFGNAFEKMIFDGQNLKESFKGLAESMARSVVNALAQMAAQWLAYQAVQMLVGKTTQAGASSAKTFEAMSAQQMAAIHAFSSTAAIPVVGPAMAPAAAGAALAATSPFVATIASLGAAAVGARATGGPVSANAPYLVGERGAEMFVPHTAGSIVPNNKLGGGGNVTVNLIEDKSRAGQSEQRQSSDGSSFIDVFVSDIMGNGPGSRAMQRAYGLQRRGY